MDWKDTLKTLAPTVASALLGPLGGAAVVAIGSIIGVDGATQEQIGKAISSGQLTPEHIAEIKKLEMQYQDNEQERGFKYADLAYKDRDSARHANVTGGTQKLLFWLSLLLLVVCIGSEVLVLFVGYPIGTPDLVVGRVLGLLDAVTMLVLAYWYGTTSGSQQTRDLLARKP